VFQWVRPGEEVVGRGGPWEKLGHGQLVYSVGVRGKHMKEAEDTREFGDSILKLEVSKGV